MKGLGRFWLRPAMSLFYRRSRGASLVYHEVFPDGGDRPHTSTQITVGDLKRQLEFIASNLCALPIDEFVGGLRRSCLPAGACLVTFDDGFADNCDIALPLLRRLDIPATFFIASGYVTGGQPYEADALHDVLKLAHDQDRVELDYRPWGGPTLTLSYSGTGRSSSYFRVVGIYKRQIRHVHRRAFIEYTAERFGVSSASLRWPAMLTPSQVRQLADAGMTIGSHTEWHASLAAEGVEEYVRQLRVSRQVLRDVSGQSVDYFSYPYGDPEYCLSAWPHVRDAGYSAAFMACGLVSKMRLGPYLIDRQATSGGVAGLCASLLGLKPSQFRQRRALSHSLARGVVECT